MDVGELRDGKNWWWVNASILIRLNHHHTMKAYDACIVNVYGWRMRLSRGWWHQSNDALALWVDGHRVELLSVLCSGVRFGFWTGNKRERFARNAMQKTSNNNFALLANHSAIVYRLNPKIIDHEHQQQTIGGRVTWILPIWLTFFGRSAWNNWKT